MSTTPGNRVRYQGQGIVLAMVAIGLLAAALYWMYLQNRRQQHYRDRMTGARSILNFDRIAIGDYFEKNGRYPASLHELWEWALPGHEYMSTDLCVTKKRQEVPEYTELNGRGGYYYDPNTGEVRINLTQPLKEYLHYTGPEANEPPSSW